MPSGTLHCIALIQTAVSENISPPSSQFLRVIEFHGCVTVVSLISLSIKGVKEHCLLGYFHGGINYYAYAHSIMSYGIIFWASSAHSYLIFEILK
jgi:hypothetical protein